MVLSKTIQRVKNAKVFATITGGGTQFVTNQLVKGGASKWFAGSYTPYSIKLIHNILKHVPEHYVSEEVAKNYANLSLIFLKPEFEDYEEDGVMKTKGVAIAIGVTAGLKKENEREDRKNHAWISVLIMNDEIGYNQTTNFYFQANKEDDREKQEKALARAIEKVVEGAVSEYVFSEITHGM